MRVRTAVCVVSGAVTVITGTALAPAAAADRAQPTGRSVTVFLKAPHPSALAALADNHTLSHSARLAALARLLPGASQRATATAALRREGFSVTDASTWLITATASSRTVTDTFGTRPALPSEPTAAQRRAATGPLPRMPAALSRVAAAVYPSTGGPAVFHDSVTPFGGRGLRNAYAAPASTAAGIAPYSGQDSNATLTIATIQLAAWNPSDLASYASEFGLPYSSSTLTEVPVGQSSVPAPTPEDDGDVEVDLDQEALLSTDPYAHQRAYFARNTAAGFAAAYEQVLDDVLQNKSAYRGGDSHIVALTSSWGECEKQTGNTAIRRLEPIMQSLDAAGVTLFASSGDDGAYDQCGSSANVDYPASSPENVGVGGTTLTTRNDAANAGNNWTETAWSCTSRKDCSNNGGSGGGVSTVFAKPHYQSSTVKNPPYAAAGNRLVPDIAADANPDTGFVIYSSDPTDTEAGPNLQVGGTSFAAPTEAALFTAMLAAHGATSGIGDIHRALYQSLGDADALRDITSGHNGADGVARSGASTSAGSGYDTVTGLGAPLWSGVAARLYPATVPSVTAGMTAPRLHRRTSTYQVRLTWSSRPSPAGTPLRETALVVRRAGATGTVLQTTKAAGSGAITFTGKPGSTYTLTATAVDTSGDISTSATRTVTLPVDDRGLRLTGAWRRSYSGSAVGGSYLTTSRSSASASARVTGGRYSLFVRVGPSFGRMVVTVAGTRRVVNLHARRDAEKLVHVYGNDSTPVISHRITVSPASGSRRIDIDGIRALP